MRAGILLFFWMVVCTISINAQTTYKTTLSDPEIIYPGYLGLNYFTIDAGFGNTSGAFLWSVGGDVLYPITQKLRVEGVALVSLLSLNKKGLPFLMSTGVEYGVSSRIREKGIPVLLSFAWEKDYANQIEVQSWEAVKLPGHYKYELVARGGIYLRHSVLEYTSGTTYYDLTGLTHAGVYAGVGYNMYSYINAIASDGYEFAAGHSIRPYFDVMVLPTSVDLALGGGMPVKTVKETLGWRTGIVVVGKPYTAAENFNRKIPFLANTIFRLDLGKRPLEGFFITTGLAFNLKKFK